MSATRSRSFRDGAAIDNETALKIKAVENTEIVLVDAP
jgi:hypothetical protein